MTLYFFALKPRLALTLTSIQLLQFCTHNEKHPRTADSIRDSHILSATIQEYCDTLFLRTQAALSFDAYGKTLRCKAFRASFTLVAARYIAPGDIKQCGDLPLGQGKRSA